MPLDHQRLLIGAWAVLSVVFLGGVGLHLWRWHRAVLLLRGLEDRRAGARWAARRHAVGEACRAVLKALLFICALTRGLEALEQEPTGYDYVVVGVFGLLALLLNAWSWWEERDDLPREIDRETPEERAASPS